MDPNTFPTKGNLIKAKNSLALSRQGSKNQQEGEQKTELLHYQCDWLSKDNDLFEEKQKECRRVWRILSKLTPAFHS